MFNFVCCKLSTEYRTPPWLLEDFQLNRLENQPLNSPTTGEVKILLELGAPWCTGDERAMGEPSIAKADFLGLSKGNSSGGAARF